VGGNEAVTVISGQVRLNVAAGSLADDTAVTFLSYDTFSPSIPDTAGTTPLGEVTVDLSAATLNASASLTFTLHRQRAPLLRPAPYSLHSQL